MFNGISDGFPARDEIFPEMQHQAKFSGIRFLHGTAATTSTTTTITSQPPLSPTTVTTTTITTTTTDESFIFTSSTFIFVEGSLARKLHFHIFYVHFWGKSRTKASFSRLPRSIFEGSFARKLHFHIFHFQFQQLIQETSEPCHVLRLLAALGGATRAKNNSFSMGRVWQIGIMWFFGYRFVVVRVIVWDTWLDQENLQNNDSGKPFFSNFLMLLEQSLRLPRKTKSTNSKRNRGKSGIYSTHAVPAARPQGETLRQSSSFLPPAWRVVTN